MNVFFTQAEALSHEQMAEFSRVFNKPLTTELEEFLCLYSNARPLINNKPCCFKIVHADGWTTSAYVERIVSPRSLPDLMENHDNLEDYMNWFNLSTDDVEAEYLFPLAATSNGTLYTAIGGKHLGKVYVADSGDFGIIFQSKNMNDFWTNVYELA